MKHIIIILLLTLPSCNQKTFTGKIYLVGYDSQWISSEKTLNFIRQQSIPEEYMKSVRYGTELIISEDKLVGVNDYNYGRRGSKKKFSSFSYPFNKLEIEKNTPYAIVSGQDSKSYLGGEAPKELEIPKINNEISFQYFGLLAKDEFPSERLKFDLHLIAPIYDSFSELYLDYSNPLKPKIIRGTESHFSKTFDEMNSSSKVTFNKTAISFNKGGLRYGFGNTGVAKWIQAPFYPRCPISGEEMKFLVSFDMDENKEQIAVDNLIFNVAKKNLGYFENLEFWISGAIYVFINPNNNTVCYFLQTT